MTEFTPWLSLAGGALIGLSAVLLMALHGRIAGMAGIMSGLIPPLSRDRGRDWDWRVAFLAGAVVAPALLVGIFGSEFVQFESRTPALWLILGGMTVGVGVHFASGCTSGHGVCGIARLSPRSITATLIFMASTAATVFVIRHMLGGF